MTSSSASGAVERFFEACAGGTVADVTAALATGLFDVDVRSDAGTTGLHEAARKGLPGGVFVCARICQLTREGEGRADVCRWLVANGASANAPDAMGYTALHWAAAQGTFLWRGRACLHA